MKQAAGVVIQIKVEFMSATLHLVDDGGGMILDVSKRGLPKWLRGLRPYVAVGCSCSCWSDREPPFVAITAAPNLDHFKDAIWKCFFKRACRFITLAKSCCNSPMLESRGMEQLHDPSIDFIE